MFRFHPNSLLLPLARDLVRQRIPFFLAKLDLVGLAGCLGHFPVRLLRNAVHEVGNARDKVVRG